ncbi:MAG: ABC transporter substrate-binding protein [Burkholderiaceae bacterium]|jgi:ABC-type transport system substrate-binding protein|nr:ABC transporter substrate-binding protein [Burkholderiaceae bacterium]
MKRRTVLAAGAFAAGAPGRAAASAPAAKVLRVAMPTAETGFDPPRVSDATSVAVVGHIFEPPLTFDYLARPSRLRPLTAAALPEVSDGYRCFVFTIRRGIVFADDPVFGGRPRELTAADHVYAIKRLYDPAITTEWLYVFENAKVLGLGELRRRVIAARTPFPYDEEVEGLRVLDRYRFEVRIAEPDPRFVLAFTNAATTGAVAREVVEAYAADPMAHPVGTGPFRLAQWRRSSLIVLERNPRFRGEVFDSLAEPGDDAALAAQRHLQGRTLPLVDRVEIAIIEEAQPRWLAFQQGDLDLAAVPPEFAPVAAPGGELAPYLAQRGIGMQRTLMASTAFTFFNCEDQVVGGNAPERVALRRAVALACDNAEMVRLAWQGQGVPAQSMIAPHNVGFDPVLVSELARPDPARAKALLDLHGWVDRDGDGWRETPDGKPLVLRLANVGDQRSRLVGELWRRRMEGIGLRFAFDFMPFAELIKRTLAGRLQMSAMSWNAGPDADFYLGLAYGPNAGQSNDARFRLDAYDRLYERQRALPDGPERFAAMRDAVRTMLAYMPYIPHLHPVALDLVQPHVRGWVREPFGGRPWMHVDVVRSER